MAATLRDGVPVDNRTPLDGCPFHGVTRRYAGRLPAGRASRPPREVPMPEDDSPLFRPLGVGTMTLDHRLVVPPHSGGGGLLLGTDDQFERMCRYWLARVDGGMQWLGGGPIFVRNPLIPGFEPT